MCRLWLLLKEAVPFMRPAVKNYRRTYKEKSLPENGGAS
jgi:hypothetical protein